MTRRVVTQRALLVFLCTALGLLSTGFFPDGPASVPATVVAEVDSSQSVIHYTGSAVAHDWRGTSRSVTGTLRLDTENPATSEVAVRVPAATFDSGNERRDRKMREVLDVESNPEVQFEARTIAATDWGRTQSGQSGIWRVAGPLTFHGVTHEVEADVQVRLTSDSVYARVDFPVSLTRFEVDRPRLMFVPIADEIQIEARIQAAVVRE